MDSILPPPAILASSTSGIPMSRIQSECKHPERCVTGHPFNPPHLVPLVEVVGGAKTSAETIERAMRFYTAMGKRAMHIRKEVMGHVANRLAAALYREVAYLIDQDVVSVADADAAVCMGPGLRWALMGPNLIYHLGGGPGRAKLRPPREFLLASPAFPPASSARSEACYDITQEPRAAINETRIKLDQLGSGIESNLRVLRGHNSAGRNDRQ